MTAAAPARADRGVLTALAIAYGKAGVHDRATKLAHASAFAGRSLTSTSELTRDEALELRRQLQRGGRARCNLDGRLLSDHDHAVLEEFGRQLEGRASGEVEDLRTLRAVGPVMANGEPNPTGTGRYCPPSICWCGECSWWTPAPPVNYAAAIAKLAEGGERR
jgi:hypothetical protein